MKSVSNVIVLVAWAILVAACGGGGGDTSPVSAAPPSSSGPPSPVADYSVIDLDPPAGHFRAAAVDLNDNGQIVGWSGGQQQTAVLWTLDAAGAVTLKELGTLPGGTFSLAWGINNRGQVVGFADGASGTRRSFIWTEANGMRDLGVPVGLVGGEGHRINDLGQCCRVCI